MLIGFWKEDDHANNMVERQNIINDMMQLSILFESGLRQQTVFIESLRREPQYLVQMGVVSGVAMEVVIQSSVGCDEPLVVCQPAIITLNGDSFLTVNSGAGANIRLVDENGDEVEPESVAGSVIELPPIGGGDATVTLMGDAFLTIPAGDTENILIQDASDSNIEPSSVTGNTIKYNINIKPHFTVAPVLSASGNQNVGTVITCGNGTVLGVPTITYSYQWKRNGVNFVNANNTYTLLVGDVGTVITCSVTATNGFGSDSELTSNSVTVTAQSSIVATGGTITYAGGKTIHTFTSSGNFNVSFAPNGAVIDALIIAGGGGGGVYFGAGGGAGGVIQLSADSLVAGNYPVVIGAGGAAATSIVFKASNGNNTTFKGNTAIGGGGGGSGAGAPTEANGANGGSGGGGAGTGTGGTGEVGQGFDGIGGYGGSGGGAGGNANVGTGNAGVGISSAISGTSLFYAGGGGGATKTGGSGVGGNGSDGSNIGLTAPTPNTGSGGGGMWSAPNVLGAGAAGVVIISYNTN